MTTLIHSEHCYFLLPPGTTVVVIETVLLIRFGSAVPDWTVAVLVIVVLPRTVEIGAFVFFILSPPGHTCAGTR